jgi:hypothetical protein
MGPYSHYCQPALLHQPTSTYFKIVALLVHSLNKSGIILATIGAIRVLPKHLALLCEGNIGYLDRGLPKFAHDETDVVFAEEC